MHEPDIADRVASLVEQAVQQSMDAARMTGSSKLHRDAAAKWGEAAVLCAEIPNSERMQAQIKDAQRLELQYAQAIDEDQGIITVNTEEP